MSKSLDIFFPFYLVFLTNSVDLNTLEKVLFDFCSHMFIFTGLVYAYVGCSV